MSTNLSSTRRVRALNKAKAYEKSDPRFALENIERLMTGGDADAGILELHARILMRVGNYLTAETSLEKALELGGERDTLLPLLINASANGGDHKKAAMHMTSYLGVPEDQLSDFLLDNLANTARRLENNELAKRLYEILLKRMPQGANCHASLGGVLQSLGKMDEAEAYYDNALKLNPGSAITWYLLANLKKQAVGSNHIDSMLEVAAAHSEGEHDYSLITYAIGKEYEDIGDSANAFKYFQIGAKSVRCTNKYNPQADKRFFQTLKQYFDNIDIDRVVGCPDVSPIFIVGMPRTGSTLVDRVLSSHSDVVSMGELTTLKNVMKRVFSYRGEPRFVESFYEKAGRDIDFRLLGEMYVELAKPAGFVGGRFTDKNPMNHIHIGLLALALPNARFIHTARGPMDSCLSNYKQIFTPGYYNYSYDIEESANHFILYRDLMDFWHKLFPGRIIDVHYEQLVSRPKEQIERLLGLLDLEWQDSCLAFHKNKSSVSTASVSQVRQPIYSSSVDRWKCYEQELSSARRVFEQAGIDID